MDEASKPKIVLDTNLLISALLILDSLPDQVLQAWRNDKYDLVICDEILEEIKEVAAEELVTTLELAAIKVIPIQTSSLPIHSRDKEDDFLLTCALTAKADFLITGDKDLLDLSKNPHFKNLQILSARDFLKILSLS